MHPEEYILDIIVHILNGWLSFRYAEVFLRRKYENRRKALLIWVGAYSLGQILCGQLMEAYPLYGRFAQVIPYFVLLAILQKFFFERNIPRQTFVVVSFVAGWEILRFAASPLAHTLLGLWGPFWGWMLETFAAQGLLPIDELTEAMAVVNRAAVWLVLGICRGIQLGVLFLYLRLIGKYAIGMEDELKAQESWFLMVPCITVLCIDLTMRLMAYSVDNSALMLIYERVPETLVLLPLVSLLLLGIVVSSVILFRGVVQSKDEERKRLLLENRVVDVHRQIEELQEVYGDMRGLRHDLRAHIASIAAYVRNYAPSGNGELEAYLKGMESTVSHLEFDDSTGNAITDVILHQARQQAKRKGISFSADFHYPAHASFDVYDVSIILNNALQNAIEACEKMPAGSIELRSYEKGSLFFLEVENDFDGHLVWGKDEELPVTTKQEKRMHGIGLDNIRRSAKKYRGDLEILVMERKGRKLFQLTVMLYGKEDSVGD